MTEQERFEAWFKTHPDFKVLAGMFGNPFSCKADGSYELSVVRTALDSWQAAQQKEGFVLVAKEMPSTFAENLYKYLNDISVVDKYQDGFIPLSDLNEEKVWELVVKAAQEPT